MDLAIAGRKHTIGYTKTHPEFTDATDETSKHDLMVPWTRSFGMRCRQQLQAERSDVSAIAEVLGETRLGHGCGAPCMFGILYNSMCSMCV